MNTEGPTLKWPIYAELMPARVELHRYDDTNPRARAGARDEVRVYVPVEAVDAATKPLHRRIEQLEAELKRLHDAESDRQTIGVV